MNKIKISLILNITIVLMVMFASIIMFTGFKFMSGSDIVLESTSLGMFRFFTVDSNLFIGIISLIYIIYEVKLVKGKIKKLPSNLNIIKYIATVSVALTFTVVFLYLGPITKGGVILLLKNSNLFFHLLIPLLSIITLIFFDNVNNLKFCHTFYGLVPTFLYGVFYIGNILIHMENGKVLPKYDWYYFVQNGVWTAVIVIPIMLLITYIISLLLYKFSNKK